MSLIYLFNITENYADEFKGKEEEFAISNLGKTLYHYLQACFVKLVPSMKPL